MTLGQFDTICLQAALPLCPLIGPYFSFNTDNIVAAVGIYPVCSARSIRLANTIIFQLGNAFINIGALIVLAIVIINIRVKYTAIGRKEILDFFSTYLLLTAISLALDSGAILPGSDTYPFMVAVQCGLISACFWGLMVNGFIGFQLWEDGTPRSIWFLRLSMLGSFASTFLVALLTFKRWGGSVLSPQNTTALFVLLYVFNSIFLAVYLVSQIILTLFVLKNLWSFGAISLGTIFFITGQVLLHVFSQSICTNVKHYLDGLFFASLANLFAAIMLYKYWDMITMEDLEFSVSNESKVWEVKSIMTTEITQSASAAQKTTPRLFQETLIEK